MIITKATSQGPIWLCGQNPKTNRGISRSGPVLLNLWTYEVCSGNCQIPGPAKFPVTLFGKRVALFHEHKDPCASDLCAGSPGCLGCLFTSCHSVLREFHLIILSPHQFSSVQSLSHVWLFVTPWTAAPQASLSITNSWSLLRLMSIESMMPSSHLILCHPLLLSPSIFPSIRAFSNKLVLRVRWPKDWRFSFNISPSKEYSGLISFRIDWLDPLSVQGTLKSLLQHHSSKVSILWHSAFFMVQLSHLYMTTGKTIALIIWTFVGNFIFCFLISCLDWW